MINIKKLYNIFSFSIPLLILSALGYLALEAGGDPLFGFVYYYSSFFSFYFFIEYFVLPITGLISLIGTFIYFYLFLILKFKNKEKLHFYIDIVFLFVAIILFIVFFLTLKALGHYLERYMFASDANKNFDYIFENDMTTFYYGLYHNHRKTFSNMVENHEFLFKLGLIFSHCYALLVCAYYVFRLILNKKKNKNEPFYMNKIEARRIIIPYSFFAIFMSIFIWLLTFFTYINWIDEYMFWVCIVIFILLILFGICFYFIAKKFIFNNGETKK